MFAARCDVDSTFRCLSRQDFGLGVGLSELVVARSEQDESTGGYQYTIIFLEETEPVPTMLVKLLQYHQEDNGGLSVVCDANKVLAYRIFAG